MVVVGGNVKKGGGIVRAEEMSGEYVRGGKMSYTRSLHLLCHLSSTIETGEARDERAGEGRTSSRDAGWHFGRCAERAAR